MMDIQQTQIDPRFHQGEHVIWHCKDSNRTIPVPGVVIREEQDGILIKARFQGIVQELHVDPNQLVPR